MPELPEVETLCRQLKPVILNKQILSVEILDSKLGSVVGLVGKKVASVARHGKVLAITLDNDITLLLHLRMTGRLQWQTGQQALPPHTRFVMTFSTGTLLCIDPRRFATLTLKNNEICVDLNKDPLQNYRTSQLWDISRKKKLSVKAFLMDQRIIAGIGNIYACEILHEASVDPVRSTCSVSRQELERITAAGKNILNRAIACRGTTVSDWRDLFGRKGEYQHELKVYSREGLPCPRCQSRIQRIRLNGRGTYFCPSCQK
jgi:formamidopyrimidine-DNA glycosylase